MKRVILLLLDPMFIGIARFSLNYFFASSLAKLASTILCILFLWIAYMSGQSQYSQGFRRVRVSVAGDHAAIAEIPVKAALAAKAPMVNLSAEEFLATA